MNHSLDPTRSQYRRESLERYARRMAEQVHATGRSQKSIAIDLRMDEGQLCDTLAGRRALGVHDLTAWDREVGPGLLDYILAQRDTSAEPVQAAGMNGLFASLERQHGVAASDLIQALEDGRLTSDEARLVLPDVLRFQSTLAELVRGLQEVAG